MIESWPLHHFYAKFCPRALRSEKCQRHYSAPELPSSKLNHGWGAGNTARSEPSGCHAKSKVTVYEPVAKQHEISWVMRLYFTPLSHNQ